MKQTKEIHLNHNGKWEWLVLASWLVDQIIKWKATIRTQAARIKELEQEIEKCKSH